MAASSGYLIRARYFQAGLVVGAAGVVAGPRLARWLGRRALARIKRPKAGKSAAAATASAAGAVKQAAAKVAEAMPAAAADGAPGSAPASNAQAPKRERMAATRKKIEAQLGAALNRLFQRLGLNLRASAKTAGASEQK